MQRGEVLRLTWDNIDFEKETLTVRKLQNGDIELLWVPTKTATSNRSFKMTVHLRDILLFSKTEQKCLKKICKNLYSEVKTNLLVIIIMIIRLILL